MLHWIPTANAVRHRASGSIRGLKKDFNAVIAAVETSWSNGQTEGPDQPPSRPSSARCMDVLDSIYFERRVLPYQAMATPNLHRKCGRSRKKNLPNALETRRG